jgi:hypothetical protein
MRVVPEMGFDNVQSSFLYILCNSFEKLMRGLVPFPDEGFDVLLLDYERITAR